MPTFQKALKTKRSKQRGPTLPRALLSELSEQGQVVTRAKAPKPQQSKKARIQLDKRSSDRISIPASSGRQEIDAELRLQATLAKKLKLKASQGRTGPEDGLDELLKGFEDLTGSVSGGPVPPTSTSYMDDPVDSDDPQFGNSSPTSSDDDDDEMEDELTSGSEEAKPAEPTGAESEDELEADDESNESEDAPPLRAAQQERSAGTAAQQKARTSAGQHRELPDNTASGSKYVPPALRKTTRDEPGQDVGAPDESAFKRQVRSLLNRVATGNLVGIASQLADLFGGMPRHTVISTIIEAMMQAVEDGPRSADQFSPVMSCLIIMVSSLSNVQELLACTISALAQGLEQSRYNEDSIASSNITRVLCYMYVYKGIGSKVVYSLLESLKVAFSDADVQLIHLVLNTVGHKLRSDDSVGMKQFIESVHAKSVELASSNQLSQRARLMLELIVDIKNNRKRKRGPADMHESMSPEVLRQMKSCNVDAVTLHHISWDQLCASDHKGTWWLPGSHDDQPGTQPSGRQQPGVGSHPEAVALLQLANKQRMNTESRRAVFCVLMSADDYMDAFERIARLPLKGAAERDISHVIVHCCLQEQQWNPYYALVASQIAGSGKAHRNNVQSALADRMRRLGDLNSRQATNLASLVAHLLIDQVLPWAVFKAVDLSKSAKRDTVFSRLCFQRILSNCKSEEALRTLFGKLKSPELRSRVAAFFQKSMGPWAAGLQASDEQHALLRRIQMVEATLRT